MNSTITANDLKKKGIGAVDKYVQRGAEVVAVSVRGQEKYMIVTAEEFNRLRECELTAALVKSQEDIKKGRFHTSLEKHLREVKP